MLLAKLSTRQFDPFEAEAQAVPAMIVDTTQAIPAPFQSIGMPGLWLICLRQAEAEVDEPKAKARSFTDFNGHQ